MNRRSPIACAFGVLAVAMTAAGCGSSSSSTTAASKPDPVTATTATPPPRPIMHLRILSPRPGAHTGQTVTVHVAVTGSPQPGANAFRYALDRGRTKDGPARFILRGLSPGLHHLVVMLANNRSVKATRSFIVRTPPPPPAPAPAQTAPPATQTQAPAPAPAPAPTPQQTTTSSPPPPPPTTPSGGIPQNNGGDMDSDNNGGPSDGDGNL
jgi:hypothetical protein